tara:strand:- start:832 stop:1179 length:348 start_codon:yes stop_codon:yes gene_type:complete
MPKLKIDFKDDLERITYKICSLKKRIKTNNKIVEELSDCMVLSPSEKDKKRLEKSKGKIETDVVELEILKVEKLALDNSTIILPKFNVSIPPILVIKPVARVNKVLLHSEYFLPI